MTAISDEAFKSRAVSWRHLALVIGIAAPFFYLAGAMKIGAIRFPYWDAIAIAHYIVEYFDGTISLSKLVEVHSQSRPLFPRLIFIGTAALTDWDLRPEYLWLAATIYGAALALLVAIWSLSPGWPMEVRLSAMMLISIIAFSPAGAMNHEWSLMLIATLHYVCAMVAMLLAATRLHSVASNVIAAGLVWVATYSMGQGLLLFPVMVMLHQIDAPRRFVPTRLSLFWLSNMAACLALYLPLPGTPGTPEVFHFFAFLVVYIGSPLGCLLWLPYHGAIDLPHTTGINAACGATVIVAVAVTTWRAVNRPQTPFSLIFLSFAAFGVTCALATAWGRANGAYPVQAANSSRYSVFAALILFGLIFYYAPIVAANCRNWYVAAFLAFVGLSAVSYYRGVKIYQISGAQNEFLRASFAPNGQETEIDIKVYPGLDEFRKIKKDLARLKIGPYRP
ncbi:MAG: hypothetical protein ACJ8EF_04680 [Bradyrhizobium sp.]|jgi:hypothetical protein